MIWSLGSKVAAPGAFWVSARRCTRDPHALVRLEHRSEDLALTTPEHRRERRDGGDPPVDRRVDDERQQRAHASSSDCTASTILCSPTSGRSAELMIHCT